MNTDQSKESIFTAIQKVEHPAIASTLVDLGMIRDVEFTDSSKLPMNSGSMLCCSSVD